MNSYNKERLYQRTLCKENSQKLGEINNYLQEIGCDKGASEIYRRDLNTAQ
jgi:hypothetical protein